MKVVEVWKEASGKISAKLTSGEFITGSTVLIAAGRKLRTEDTGLENVGIAALAHRLPVDPSMCGASAKGNWVYAVGDTNTRVALTHMGEYQGRIVAAAIVARACGMGV